MSSRRSARISAATELKATLAPPSLMPPPPLPAPVKQSRKRKATVETAADTADTADTTANIGLGLDAAAAILPKTPLPRKRRAPRASTPPPLATPTPSNAKLMGEPASDGIEPRTPEAKKPRARGVTRLAPPNATLATLVSPESSRIVTSKDATRAQSVSPMKQPPATQLGAAPLLGPITPLPKPPTTANILEEACRHLIAVDARMKTLVDAHHCRVFSPEGIAEQIDPFESLCSGILSQQVSGAAAKAIKKRFVSLFYPEDAAAKEATEQSKGDWDDVVKTDPRFPHPSQVITKTIEELRTAGLSQRKAEYILGLAEKFVNGELSAQKLADAPYDDLIEMLTSVRGLGVWSAEMFAFFGLKRMDVFSLGDLGVQRGMAAFSGRDVSKLKNNKGKWKYMNEADMTAMGERYKPYRSLFMWYMWRVEGTDVSTME